MLGLFAVILIAVVYMAVNKFYVRENFGMLPSFVPKVWRTVGNNKGDFYSVPGQYQSMLAPRFSSVDYGANIRYNMPSYDEMAVPNDPLSMSDMVKSNNLTENYGAPRCDSKRAPVNVKHSDYDLSTNYSAGNFDDVTEKTYTDAGYPDVQSMLPVGDMTTTNSLGEVSQAVVYDRLVYANRNSRLRGLGDKIRGDLPVVPTQVGWFAPSVHPSIDLEPGALNVLGGFDAEQNQALTKLINTSSAGAMTAIGGIDTTMTPSFSATLGASMNDLKVSSYP